MPSNDADSPHLGNRRDTPASRMKLPKLNCTEPFLSFRERVDPDTARQADTNGEQGEEQDIRDPGDGSTPSPSDDGADNATRQKSLAEIRADKKKMKRFR